MNWGVNNLRGTLHWTKDKSLSRSGILWTSLTAQDDVYSETLAVFFQMLTSSPSEDVDSCAYRVTGPQPRGFTIRQHSHGQYHRQTRRDCHPQVSLTSHSALLHAAAAVSLFPHSPRIYSVEAQKHYWSAVCLYQAPTVEKKSRDFRGLVSGKHSIKKRYSANLEQLLRTDLAVLIVVWQRRERGEGGAKCVLETLLLSEMSSVCVLGAETGCHRW